jgi:peroxiredoxin
MRKSVIFLAVICVGVVVGSGIAGSKDKPKVRVGMNAPDFALRDLESNLIRLSDIAYPGEEKSWKKKKQVLMDFFRTDCEPCKKELPEVIKYHDKHKDKVQVILIALLESENGREKLDSFLKKHKLPFPVLVDAYESVAKKYIVDDESLTLPSIFYIDKQGLIRARFVGLKHDLEKSIENILKKQKKLSK